MRKIRSCEMSNLVLVPPTAPPTTALKKSAAQKVKAPRPIDRRRYALHKKGHTVEEIASIEKVSPEMINKSLLAVTMYQDFYSHDAVDAQVNEMFLNRLDSIKEALDTALSAERITYVPQKDGTIQEVKEVDNSTRLKAI